MRLLDDLDSDNWNDYKMIGEKVTLYDDKLHFGDSDVVLTLKRDILSMITDYDSDKTNSPDAKQINNFLGELHSDIHAKNIKPRAKNLLWKKSYTNTWVKNHFLFRKFGRNTRSIKIISKSKAGKK